MKDLARFLTTYNMADQTVAVDGTNVYNIQSTGTAACVINGVYVPSLTADAELLIITDQAAPTVTTESWPLLTAAGVTTWAVDDEVYTGTLTGISQKFYKCLVAHRNDESLEPADNPDLWQAIPNIDTLSLVDDATLWVMITAESSLGTLGKLGIWIASTELGDTSAPTNGIVVPYFDPSYYCVVAFGYVLNNIGSATGIVGAAGTGAGYIDWTSTQDLTYYVQLGPVFPAAANMPKN
jgi:hypothetical protein